MVVSQRMVTLLQFAGAALGIPAAAAGAYTAYQTFFSSEATCQKLRSNILATMERRIAPDAKHTLLRKDVAEFDKTCGEADPDARVIFQAAVQDATPPAMQRMQPVAAQTTASIAKVEPAPTSGRPALAVFGAAGSTERHGWVALSRRDKTEGWVVNFSGYAISETSLPPAGTVLRAQRNVPVWSEMQPASTNDMTKLQNRLTPGTCVRVLATRPGGVRLWAEVAPASCS